MERIEIKRVGITEQKERTWGRVFLDYTEGGVNKFIFKNWIKFKEENFEGDGSFINESAFDWFDSKFVVEDYEDVLDGIYDNKVLTINSRYKDEYGTPSRILISILEDLDVGMAKNIKERRGWYNK